MLDIHSFLFFLQSHKLYFAYQESILQILRQYPDNTDPRIFQKIVDIEPRLQWDWDKNSVPFTRCEFHRARYGEAHYPVEFQNLIDPPLVFSYMGNPIWKGEKIAVVGSRQPSQKSIWWMSQELRQMLVSTGLVSVSGGAIGVDQLAHQISIDLKLPTIAILPSGLNNLYPQRFSKYVDAILKNGGCIVSEFSDDQPVFKHHFSFRNRLIAALGKVSVIVEAKEKSGTLITAHRALEMGKEVFVVPGHPLDDNFKGSLSLLKLGAHILTEAQDIEFWM